MSPVSRFFLAVSLLPLVACGGGPTGPDAVDINPNPAPASTTETIAPVSPGQTCDIKGFKAEPANFVGQTVFPKVIRVKLTNPQAACAAVRLTVWDATNPEDQKFVADSAGRFPPDSELSLEIPCGMYVQVDVNNSPFTPDRARYSPGYFVKGWRGWGPACPTPTPTPTPIPTPTPTPPPNPSLVCAPGDQTVAIGETARLTAQGGNGQYEWTAVEGSPTSGNSANFSTRYRSEGTKTVTVTSAGQTRTCRVNVPPPPPVDLMCTPDDQTVSVGDPAQLSARGGNGQYEWSAPGGSPASGNGSRMETRYSSSGTKSVTVTSGGQTKTCRVKVPPPPSCDDSNPPYSHYSASGTVNHINSGHGVDVRATATLANGRYSVKLMARSGSQEWVKDETEVRVECRDGRRQAHVQYRNESAHASSRFWVRIDPIDGGVHATRDFNLN